MSWEHKDTEALIEMYREAPQLWDTENPDFKSRTVIRKIYRTMAKRFNRPIFEVKSKLKSLRCMFQRQYRKNKQDEKSGKRSSSSVWCGYKSMSFLQKVYDKKGPRKRVVTEDQGDSEEFYEEIHLDEDFLEQSDNDECNATDLMWTRDAVRKLINMYKEQSILWDTDHPNYHHKQMRVKALKLIADSFETTIPEIKNKMKNLRTMFMTVHKKVKASIAQNGTFKGKLWFGYKRLGYLVKEELPELDEELAHSNDTSWKKEFDDMKGSDTEEKTRTVWHQQLFLQLIQLYKDQRLLWDSEHEDHNNKAARIASLQIIAQILDKPRREVESKIKNLRTQFFKNNRKIQKIIRTEGKFTGKLWFGYKPMKFLLNQTQTNYRDDDEEEDSIKKELFSCEDDDVHDNDESDDEYDDHDDDDANSHVSTNSKEMLELPAVKSEKKRKYSESCSSNDPLEFINNKKKKFRDCNKNNCNATTEDEYTVFGQFITQELRKIKDEDVLMITKKQLSDIVFQAQIQQASASR